MTRFTDPLKHGDYPQLLKDIRGELLPTFTSEEKSLLKGSTDFLALVYPVWLSTFANGAGSITIQPT